jgi:cell division septal protein FtsQ
MLKTKKKIISKGNNEGPKKIFKKRWFWNFVLFLIFFLGLTWLFLKSPLFEIKKIKISSSKKIEKGVKKIALKENNFFLLNQAKVSAGIKNKFPQVKNVKIKKQFPSTIFLKVTERKSLGFFCSVKDNPSCFLISEEGVLFKKQKPTKGALVFFGHDVKKVNSGDIVIKKELFREIISFIKELKKLKIYPQKIEIFPFEIRMKTNKGFKIYFAKNNFKSQKDVFITIFKKNISAKEKKNLQYIDLRVLENGEKGAIYWK